MLPNVEAVVQNYEFSEDAADTETEQNFCESGQNFVEVCCLGFDAQKKQTVLIDQSSLVEEFRGLLFKYKSL